MDKYLSAPASVPKLPLAERESNTVMQQDLSALKAIVDKVCNKRAAPEEFNQYFSDSDGWDDDNDDDTTDYDPKLNCNHVRTRIRSLIDSGEMKVTHFQRELGINSNSYGRFMKLKGPWTGIDNQTYHAAYKFFKRREMAGVKAPAKKRKSNDGSAVKNKGDNPDLDVSGIHLDFEEENAVELYDTPAEIRRKISAHMPHDGVTKAGFARTLGEMYHPARKIQSGQLDTFRGYKHPDQGNQSCIYYAAYVYFEKLRLKENKPKSKHRQEMERIWGSEGGFDIKHKAASTGGILMCGNGGSMSASMAKSLFTADELLSYVGRNWA